MIASEPATVTEFSQGGSPCNLPHVRAERKMLANLERVWRRLIEITGDDCMGCGQKNDSSNDVPYCLKCQRRHLSKHLGVSPHEWSGGPLNQCVLCETWHDQKDRPCDPTETSKKMEPCCDCGADYPRTELLRGHVFCGSCRNRQELGVA